ncbi:ABC transporter permease (plasmid) [Polaromonas sp. P1-6]|nr:ABC transporter permease [Polaromonas sp. P1-6]
MNMFNKPATDTQITHLQRLWLYVLCALIMAFLILPCLLVIPMSFSASTSLSFPPKTWSVRWYEAYLFEPEWQDATIVSLKVAVLTLLFATPLGTAAAYGLSILKGRAAGVIRTLFMLPMMVPSILVAVGAFFVYVKLDLNNTLTGLVLAHTMLALPFVLITVSNGLQTYDMNQELVARSLGASRLKAFFTVTLPQIRFSIISGALLAFITSFDEVIVAIFVSSGENTTLTRRMFANIRDQLDPTVAAISSILITLSIVVLLCMQLLQRKRPGAV